jgi:hypothetical protein
MSCNIEHTLIVLFGSFRSNCYLHFLILYGNGNVGTDEELKNKNKT